MDKMDKPIKQFGAIQTSVVDPTNTPNVPEQFQTGTYYDPTMMVQQPPMPTDMSQSMGTYPITQTDPPVEAMDAKTGKPININKPTREGTASSNAYNIMLMEQRKAAEKAKENN